MFHTSVGLKYNKFPSYKQMIITTILHYTTQKKIITTTIQHFIWQGKKNILYEVLVRSLFDFTKKKLKDEKRERERKKH